jgi:hypothetical protein
VEASTQGREAVSAGPALPSCASKARRIAVAARVTLHLTCMTSGGSNSGWQNTSKGMWHTGRKLVHCALLDD